MNTREPKPREIEPRITRIARMKRPTATAFLILIRVYPGHPWSKLFLEQGVSMLDSPATPTPAPSDPETQRIAAIIDAAPAGASLAEIAAALELTEHQLVRR